MERYGSIESVLRAEIVELGSALDAAREKVKELKEWQRVVVGTGTDQEAVVRMAATEYTKTAVQCWKDENAKLTAQLATLQAQLADRDAMILQMGEQAAVLAKENMAAKDAGKAVSSG